MNMIFEQLGSSHTQFKTTCHKHKQTQQPTTPYACCQSGLLAGFFQLSSFCKLNLVILTAAGTPLDQCLARMDALCVSSWTCFQFSLSEALWTLEDLSRPPSDKGFYFKLTKHYKTPHEHNTPTVSSPE